MAWILNDILFVIILFIISFIYFIYLLFISINCGKQSERLQVSSVALKWSLRAVASMQTVVIDYTLMTDNL